MSALAKENSKQNANDPTNLVAVKGLQLYASGSFGTQNKFMGGSKMVDDIAAEFQVFPDTFFVGGSSKCLSIFRYWSLQEMEKPRQVKVIQLKPSESQMVFLFHQIATTVYAHSN